ncbi:hypothetical protein Pla163_21570 [Planctomycetes bacterium Pla163]|jgi:hypothetical protein|uniref:Uncharacterized protein n=1 Tax=Rohdeia mirabilis TaxID=2528008 RepID=A0A518D0N0_9BACT|nr:hypothetical protein Pla163_21570 [Planctomycetes bacterium Pla163]
MNLEKKHLVAFVALGAVAMVWVPRLTGWDPMGLYATASPVADGVAANGSAEWPGVGAEGPNFDSALTGALGEGALAGSGVAATRPNSPVGELGTVLAFLENRDRLAAQNGETRGAAAIATNTASKTTTADSPSTLDAFLAYHPLSAIAVGSKRSCALFGRTSVRPGDELLDGRIVVHAIERDGVVLDTDEGRVKVPLPTPGQLRASSRPEGRSTPDATNGGA